MDITIIICGLILILIDIVSVTQFLLPIGIFLITYGIINDITGLILGSILGFISALLFRKFVKFSTPSKQPNDIVGDIAIVKEVRTDELLVEYKGLVYWAIPLDKEQYSVGDKVVIKKVEGTKFYVEKIK